MEDRERAEKLWDMLDDIDTLGDRLRPSFKENYKEYFNKVQEILRKRHEILMSDGQKLYTPEEWEQKYPFKRMEKDKPTLRDLVGS